MSSENEVSESSRAPLKPPASKTPTYPTCHQKGKSVPGQTVKALLSVSLRFIQDTTYFFCATSSCPVVYYSADGKQTFSASQLRERVYQKEPDAQDVLVFYCFNHTVGEIRNATAEKVAAIVSDIQQGIKANQCACDLRNQQGSCFLGNVRNLTKHTQQERQAAA